MMYPFDWAQVFFWTPEPFNESTWDKDSKLVKEMNATLGNRRDPKYVGVTCEGEVCRKIA